MLYLMQQSANSHPKQLMASGMTKGKPKLSKSKRTPAHNLADKNYMERQILSGVKPRKFMLNDDESKCLREVEKFIKKAEGNMGVMLDYIGSRH
jgi:hypothetical protein